MANGNGNNTNKASIEDLKEPAREGEIVARGESAVGVIAAAEIDQAVATAHKFPRSLALFRKEALDMSTVNEVVAAECLFALRRENNDGTIKVIEGPSIRMAEIIASCWRNCRVGSRIMDEGRETVTAQGIFYDCERNVGSQSEVMRGIVNKRGRRYGLDMIVMTTNAAQAIAKRNAIQAGVPRALWWDIYQTVRKVAAGDAQSLSTKRIAAVKAFGIYGITEAQILAGLGRVGMEEVTRDDLVHLYGVLTGIRDGETTPEEAFPQAVDLRASSVRGNADAERDKKEGGEPPAQTVGDAGGIPPPADQVPPPVVAQAEPTPEQRAAHAAFLEANKANAKPGETVVLTPADKPAEKPARKSRPAPSIE